MKLKHKFKLRPLSEFSLQPVAKISGEKITYIHN